VFVPLAAVGTVGVPVSAGLAERTTLPVPVEVVTPVPPLATGNVPVTPVVKGKPVIFVAVPLEGVPSAPPLTTGAPAEPTFTAKAVATPVPKPDTPVLIGKPVALVKVPLEGVPKAGVTNVGEVANTNEPLPVSSETAVAKLALDGVAKNVATPVPKPETPVLIGRPVAFVSVTLDGVPKAGVTSVGDVANTKEPLPVSSVTVAAKLAEEGVAKNVATPVPKPETPVAIGKPVAFVKVAEEGVPKAGVTSVGEVDNTTFPVPVEVVTPVPPFKTAKVPATVTAPEVAVDGVRPVEPKLMVDTPSTTLEATLT
jgi:hypothetical protein